MKNRTLLLVLLTVGFVGATSCGDDKNAGLQAENNALRAELMMKANQPATNVNVTYTQIATAVANVTVSNVNASTGTTGGYQTTVVYTITSNNTSTGTAVRQ